MTELQISDEPRARPDRHRVLGLHHSRPGLVVAVLFFALSLAPSLLPRTALFQGVVSGITTAIGYGLGVLGAKAWRYFEIPTPRRSSRVGQALLWGPVAVVGLITLLFVWQQVGWQNDVREIFDQEPVNPAVWVSILPVTAIVAALLIVVARGISRVYDMVVRWVERVLPRRVATAVGFTVVAMLLLGLWSGVIVDGFFAVANRSFSVRDTVTPDWAVQPTSALRSGSPESLDAWDTLGREGRRFVATGPTVDELDAANGGGAREPIRVYVGINSADSLQERADLLLEELERTGAFEREVLVLVSTTGTGFIEPNAINALEYLHDGDTAIAGAQYSFLPSWISLLADQQVTRDTSRAVFDTVHAHWSALPEDERPELYLFGLSLGSFGVESILTSINIVNAPIDGALMAGPPFVNELWNQLTDDRDPGSPAWLPVYGDGRTVRFTGLDDALDAPTARWGDTRIVYLQNASDPVTFFSPDLALSRPEWLDTGQRGPDVSSEMRWFPLVTMWQVAFDLPVAGNVPSGHGHLYTSRQYLDAWVAITEPDGWTDDDTARLGDIVEERQLTIEE
ncbi:MAG TPA: alpha/beta-hydrolase family protein [Acidimicrobiales bacterium]|nr:alpha/beta-hydrolase family protein [Acidimicrobiales bacterium]